MVKLKCHCDHCPDNTCITEEGGLCYAEWVLDGRDSGGHIQDKFNCFSKGNQLLQHLVCNETPSNTSHIIRRCCNSRNYCNRDLLPPRDEAYKLMGMEDPLNESYVQHLIRQYSALHLHGRLFVISMVAMFFIIVLALYQITLSQRHKHSVLKSGLNRLIRLGAGLMGSKKETNSTDPNVSVNIPEEGVGAGGGSLCINGCGGAISNGNKRKFRKGDEIPDETSSGRNSEGAIYDNNSMASREPLIHGAANPKLLGSHVVGGGNGISGGGGDDGIGGAADAIVGGGHAVAGGGHAVVGGGNAIAGGGNAVAASGNALVGVAGGSNSVAGGNSGSTNHVYRGPYMFGDTSANRSQSTFQMTFGSMEASYRHDNSSGSGSGQPYLTQRSIAYDIELVQVIGRGYFGVVWRGEYKGEPVAVKIFAPMAEPSWEREADIYQTTMLRHKNILGFIATDKRLDATMTGFWLVTDYYPMGSLYDFLKANSMAMSDALRMAFSIANGLAHLHVEIFGTQGKPAIAHRDMKSKNILVKNDGTCCIADLGMAVRYNSITGIVDVPTNTRVGTRRYLAPEILESKLNLMDFEAVKATDIYALGLVLWEILRRSCMRYPDETDPNFSLNMSNQQASSSSLINPSLNSPPRPNIDSEILRTTTFMDNPAQSAREELQPIPSTSRASAQIITGNPVESHGLPRVSTPSHPNNGVPGYKGAPTFLAQNTFNESMETTLEDHDTRLAVVCEPYELPYHQYVSIDPSAVEMHSVVCLRKLRPPMSYRWNRFACMRDCMNLMSECWYEKPQARLTALRVRKTLSDIARKYFSLNMEYD